MTSEKRAQKFHTNDASLPRYLGSASDWLNQISDAAGPIRSTTQIWVVTRHQYGISALVSQTSFGGEISGSVAKLSAVFSGCNDVSCLKSVHGDLNFPEHTIALNIHSEAVMYISLYRTP